jgi:hypothetical protein
MDEIKNVMHKSWVVCYISISQTAEDRRCIDVNIAFQISYFAHWLIFTENHNSKNFCPFF